MRRSSKRRRSTLSLCRKQLQLLGFPERLARGGWLAMRNERDDVRGRLPGCAQLGLGDLLAGEGHALGLEILEDLLQGNRLLALVHQLTVEGEVRDRKSTRL